MKLLPWIIATAGIGTAVYLVRNAPSTQLSAADGGLESAANKTGAWGTKQRLSGTGGTLAGNLKQGAGKLTGDSDLQTEGLVDRAAGAVKDVAGDTAHSVSDALHHLNKA